MKRELLFLMLSGIVTLILAHYMVYAHLKLNMNSELSNPKSIQKMALEITSIIAFILVVLNVLFYYYHQYLLQLEIGQERIITEGHITESEALIGILCHDLSNPIQIIGIVNTNYSSGRIKSSDDFQMAFSKLQTAYDSLTDIISQVRISQAWIQGKSDYVPQNIKVSDISRHIESMFGHRLSQKKQSFEFHINSDEFELYILADRITLFHSVFSNILSNAIKFSPEGSSIQMVITESGNRVVVEIIDNGLGMGDDQLRNLFKSNKRTSTVGTLGELGTGLGMPIVKSCMDVYGGAVEVTSMTHAEAKLTGQSQGTTVRLYFPKFISSNNDLKKVA